MRTLTLLRHAKSSWDEPRLADVDRPLAPRGRKAAPLMGRHMRDIGLAPDLVLCSAAVRTRETLALVLPELGMPGLPVVYDATIYEAEAATLLARLERVADSVQHLLVIGHNPGLQELALLLVGKSLGLEHRMLAEKLPTGGLVVLALDIEAWSRIAAGSATITHLMTPRLLHDK